MLCCFFVHFLFSFWVLLFARHQMCCLPISAHNPHIPSTIANPVRTHISLCTLLFLLQDADPPSNQTPACIALSNPIISMLRPCIIVCNILSFVMRVYSRHSLHLAT
ncbi:hypothetical protein FKM82_012832 [Ascaphus truei]